MFVEAHGPNISAGSTRRKRAIGRLPARGTRIRAVLDALANGPREGLRSREIDVPMVVQWTSMSAFLAVLKQMALVETDDGVRRGHRGGRWRATDLARQAIAAEARADGARVAGSSGG